MNNYITTDGHCPECYSTNLVLDSDMGEVSCRSCGLVVKESLISTRSDIAKDCYDYPSDDIETYGGYSKTKCDCSEEYETYYFDVSYDLHIEKNDIMIEFENDQKNLNELIYEDYYPQFNEKCDKCGSEKIFTNYENVEIVCDSCGLIMKGSLDLAKLKIVFDLNSNIKTAETDKYLEKSFSLPVYSKNNSKIVHDVPELSEEIFDNDDEINLEDHLFKDQIGIEIQQEEENLEKNVEERYSSKLDNLEPSVDEYSSEILNELMEEKEKIEFEIETWENSYILNITRSQTNPPNKNLKIVENINDFEENDIVGHLVGILKDSDINVRKEAAKSLGIIGDIRAVKYLRETLNDPDKKVYDTVMDAIRMIEDKNN